jgi:hypothetical protein
MTAGRMTADCMTSRAALVTAFVTPPIPRTTSCHDNFGYYSHKAMIPRTPISIRSGIGSAIKSKLVYN